MSDAAPRKVILIPDADRPRTESVRRYRLARIASSDPRRGSDDRFAYLKRVYD